MKTLFMIDGSEVGGNMRNYRLPVGDYCVGNRSINLGSGNSRATGEYETGHVVNMRLVMYPLLS